MIIQTNDLANSWGRKGMILFKKKNDSKEDAGP